MEISRNDGNINKVSKKMFSWDLRAMATKWIALKWETYKTKEWRYAIEVLEFLGKGFYCSLLCLGDGNFELLYF